MFPALMAAGWANAQVAVPSPEALDKADANAQRESEKVFKWILIHADKPKHPAAEARPAAPASAAKPVAKAREPRDEGIVEKVEPIRPRTSAPAPAEKALAKSAPVPSPATAPQERAVAAQIPASGAAGNGGAALAEQTPPQAAPAPSPALAAASAPRGGLALSAPAAKAPQVPPPAAEEQEDEQLELVKQVDPEFPRFLIERLEKGAVQVKFDVNPDGTVSSPTVVKTSHPRLNDAAIAAVAKWRFKPLHHTQSGIVELKFDLTQ